MTCTQASLAGTTAQRLQRLAQLYQLGQASELVDRTLDKLLTYEAEASQAQLCQLRRDMVAFEKQYGLSSD